MKYTHIDSGLSLANENFESFQATNKKYSFEVLNLSDQPIYKLLQWLPNDIQAKKIVFFPDVGPPGRASLPTGTAVLTDSPNWRELAISDCGCGMMLLESQLDRNSFKVTDWENLGLKIKENKGQLGDLGGGNHFVDAISSYEDGKIFFLVHTGSRNEEQNMNSLINKPRLFDNEFARVSKWAYDNRLKISDEIQKIFGSCRIVMDKPHNTVEKLADGNMVIRKGTVKLDPGELSVLPSSMFGDVVTIEANHDISQFLNSLCHGTGRAMSRSESKELSNVIDFNEIREKVIIPSYISDRSLAGDYPECYRDLECTLKIIEPLVQIKKRFQVIAYLGHL